MTLRADSKSICLACAHFRPNFDGGDGASSYCVAFPDGIPRQINGDGFDHRLPYRQLIDGRVVTDRGVTFEPRSDPWSRGQLFEFDTGISADQWDLWMRVREKELGVVPLTWPLPGADDDAAEG